MTIQTDCTAKEWDLILQAPTLAGLVIIQADHYSLLTITRKTFATLGAIMATAQQQAGTELIQAVATAMRTGQAPWWPTEYPRDMVEAHQWALGRCRQITALLAQKAPEAEAEAFMRWLIAIGQHVALIADAPGPHDPQGTEGDARTRLALELLATALNLPLSLLAGPPLDLSADK
ncbi:MAG: hypothetical protein WCG26_02065 [Chloroflexales bacterium]